MAACASIPTVDEPVDRFDEGSEPGLVRWEAGRLDRLCEAPRLSADSRDLDAECADGNPIAS
jgi:hypothetical protein